MLKTVLKSSVFALALLGLAACSSTETQPGEEPFAVPEPEAGNGGVETSGLGQSQGLSQSELAEQQARAEQEARDAEMATLREVRTFYFEFDQSIVPPDSHMPLKAHAAFLSANPASQIVLNGYADERGTKEYNLALGERRAKAIERFLVVNGAGTSQIEVVSFGEEFPVDYGHNEEAWSKNRRVVLEYK